MMQFKLLVIAMLGLFLGACANQNIPDPEPTVTTGGSDEFGTDSDGFAEDEPGAGEFIEYEVADELTMIIYFDFDQSDIRPEDKLMLERHANQLANDSRASIRLEGHADERGSREYNIGLGERRSQAVRRLLLIQGATARQISTVSFGEERPAALGSDEVSYAQNRRVEIKYAN